MQSETENKRVLVIGSGPVVIGQAAEFDYAGSQACRILRSLGIYTVLLNSNPATIQTDEETADRIYVMTINFENAVRIIEKEKINGIVAGMAGQTGLNILLELYDRGIIEKYGIEIMGTPPEGIRLAEDRSLFHQKMVENSINVPESMVIRVDSWKDDLERVEFYPFIARTSFSLGGNSGRVIRNREEAERFFSSFFSIEGNNQLEIERSLLGLTEMEYEVIRDDSGNAIMVCNMENIDPMGVHTGESIVVTPSLTIPDHLHQEMRRQALKIAEILMIRGACNVQFAVDIDRERFYAIEANPRTSRSSALASKATGYPIAKIATFIVCGYALTEIRNPITGNTSAAFEPSQDYVTVKIPVWPSTKFPEDTEIGIAMHSVGETMGIGRSFEEAFLKAVASLEINLGKFFRGDMPVEEIRENISFPNNMRYAYIIAALVRNMGIHDIHNRTGWSEEILLKLKNITDLINSARTGNMEDNLEKYKRAGIPDIILSWVTGRSEVDILKMRIGKNLLPSIRKIDSSSGEYNSVTKYLYSTYLEEDDLSEDMERKILIMGSGPNRIAQGLEFDYSSVKAVREIRKMGLNAIMINSNPETVSTDFDISNELYFEPLTLEYVSGIIQKRKVSGIIVQFSGQTGQNMASSIAEVFGESMVLGTSPKSIQGMEDRNLFSEFLRQNNILQASWEGAESRGQIEEAVRKMGLPVIIRSGFIIGGSMIRIIRNSMELEKYLNEAPEGKYHISRFMEDAREFDLDFICNVDQIEICGIMEHIEEAGVHSGDAISIMGKGIPEKWIEAEGRRIISLISGHFKMKGFGNLQFMEKDGRIYVIEMNARASRTVPVISKFTGINWVGKGIRAILNGEIDREDVHIKGYCAKIPVFPFDRFENSIYALGPEMRSTGEAMATARDMEDLVEKIRVEKGIGRDYIVNINGEFTYFHGGIGEKVSREQCISIMGKYGRKLPYFEYDSHDMDLRKFCYMRRIPVFQGKRIFEFMNNRMEIKNIV